MVTIRKNGMVLEVPSGAFKSMYKPAGWEKDSDLPIHDTIEQEEAPVEAYEPEDHKAAQTDEEVLQSMTREELKQYASLLGIKNLKGSTNRENLIKAIEEHSKQGG